MKLLVFGRGQLGTELERRSGGGADIVALGRAEADIADAGAVRAALARHRPDAIVNAAAWTAVDAAEGAPAAAYRVNAFGAGAVAAAAAEAGTPLVHISTDYVFDGSGEAPWRPEDPVGPVNVYGASKLAGELLVAASGADAVILRSSWVYAAHGRNFVRTMLRLAAERDALDVVADQIGRPTAAATLAEAAERAASGLLADRGLAGVYHLSDGGAPISWAGFAEAVFDLAGLDPAPVVTPIRTADYPTPARRPLNSRLDIERFAAAFGWRPPDWRAALAAVVAELTGRETGP